MGHSFDMIMCKEEKDGTMAGKNRRVVLVLLAKILKMLEIYFQLTLFFLFFIFLAGCNELY